MTKILQINLIILRNCGKFIIDLSITKSYRDFLPLLNVGLTIVDSTCNLTLAQNDSIGQTCNNDLKAVLAFNHVAIQAPYFDFKEIAFSTVIWIKDQSWMGGFCVLTRFRIENGVCKFLKGSVFAMSDMTAYILVQYPIFHFPTPNRRPPN